jgi:hypothetical protein
MAGVSEHASTARLYRNAEFGRVGCLCRYRAGAEPDLVRTKPAFIARQREQVKPGRKNCLNGAKDLTARDENVKDKTRRTVAQFHIGTPNFHLEPVGLNSHNSSRNGANFQLHRKRGIWQSKCFCGFWSTVGPSFKVECAMTSNLIGVRLERCEPSGMWISARERRAQEIHSLADCK